MYDDLNKLINGRVDPTVAVAINSLVEAFELHKATLWTDRITHLLMDVENIDVNTITDNVTSILFGQAEALFSQMLIRVDMETIRIGKLAELVEALAFKPDDQDGEILAALMAGDDPVEALCDAVAIKTSMISEEWMEYIHEVATTTIEAAIAVLTRSVDRQETVNTDVTIVLGRVNKYSTLIPAGTTIAMEALAEGVQVGTSMQVLVDTYSGKLGEGDIESTVDQIVSLAILANTPPDAVLDECLFFLEQIYPELYDMQKANKVLTKRLGALAEEF